VSLDLAMRARLVGLLDLTELGEAADAAAIGRLCERAQTPLGSVAAVCLWPAFVPQAKALLAGTPVRIATVVNFPAGDEPAAEVSVAIAAALEAGADEIDYVLPYRRLLAGDTEATRTGVADARRATGDAVLKVILETGELSSPERIAEASRIALGQGADFLKTSTGKVLVNATLPAARIMLGEIARSGGPAGFKAAGGIRDGATALAYVSLAEDILGEGWATPKTFRIGASGLLDALLEEGSASGTRY
jgi:deoxyribose-phosphate aldolase